MDRAETPTSLQKLGSLREASPMRAAAPQVLCFGDFGELLRFNLQGLRWEKLKYDSQTTAFSGNLRYPSGCVTQSGLIFVTGGCMMSSGEAINTCFEARASAPGRFIKKKSMLSKRYAHATVCLNGYVYALGGFDNRDADGVAPNTLDACERFSVHENKWYHMASMNEARSFAGVCPVQDQFIYLMGGFHDFEVLQSIEKYDAVLDNWITLLVKLPVPLAKMGVASIEGGRQIAVLGGMNATYQRQRSLVFFDLKTLKFQQVQGASGDMKAAKTFNGGVHFHDNAIYALGGNERDMCERFDIYQNKWDNLQSYAEVIQGTSELNGWCQIYVPGRPSS